MGRLFRHETTAGIAAVTAASLAFVLPGCAKPERSFEVGVQCATDPTSGEPARLEVQDMTKDPTHSKIVLGCVATAVLRPTAPELMLKDWESYRKTKVAPTMGR